jgi:biofilm PGA synthesis N-glycosyltransferase PgaC
MNHLGPAAFELSALLIAYVLLGYPLLLAALARRSTSAIRKQWQPRSVTCLLPVYNGEPWIRQKLQSILALDYPAHLLQILVIDDGSTDGTGSIVAEFAPLRVESLRIPHSGKPTALNVGMTHARGELFFLTDVRQRLDEKSLRNLVECFGDPSVGVASGELIILDGNTPQEADIGVYWRYEKWIRRHLSRLDSVIGATGCIYAIRRELAVPLPTRTLLDDVYLPLAAFFKGYRVVFDSTAHAFDFPTALGSEFRRKVRTQAGVFQVTRAYPMLLLPFSRMWFHFVSHKLGRLALPHLMIVVAISSFTLPSPWALAVVTGQAGFYLLAICDTWIPATWRLKPVSSISRTAVVLLAAPLVAARFVVTGTAHLWKVTTVQPTRRVAQVDVKPAE